MPMKKIYISTVSGPSTPGIIKSLAQTTRDHGGEWIATKVMKLDNQFSALMKVSIDVENVQPLTSSIRGEFPDLQFTESATLSPTHEQVKSIDLEIDCKDREGLTRDISNIIFNLDLVVENLEFNRFPVSSFGESIFSAKLTVGVPEGTSAVAVAEEIEAISEDMRVNVL
ncbi:MAG: glycine cleavage system regulatory protein [Desulforhopalus sp.]|jgi:glycine cleavage system regulatory protein